MTSYELKTQLEQLDGTNTVEVRCADGHTIEVKHKLEIDNDRHAIIIVPNKPLTFDKVAYFENKLAEYERNLGQLGAFIRKLATECKVNDLYNTVFADFIVESIIADDCSLVSYVKYPQPKNTDTDKLGVSIHMSSLHKFSMLLDTILQDTGFECTYSFNHVDEHVLTFFVNFKASEHNKQCNIETSSDTSDYDNCKMPADDDGRTDELPTVSVEDLLKMQPASSDSADLMIMLNRFYGQLECTLQNFAKSKFDLSDFMWKFIVGSEFDPKTGMFKTTVSNVNPEIHQFFQTVVERAIHQLINDQFYHIDMLSRINYSELLAIKYSHLACSSDSKDPAGIDIDINIDFSKIKSFFRDVQLDESARKFIACWKVESQICHEEHIFERISSQVKLNADGMLASSVSLDGEMNVIRSLKNTLIAFGLNLDKDLAFKITYEPEVQMTYVQFELDCKKMAKRN